MLYVTIATSVQSGVCIGAHLRLVHALLCRCRHSSVLARQGGSQHGDAGRAFWVNHARAAVFLCILRPAYVETACARAVLTVNVLVRNNASLHSPCRTDLGEDSRNTLISSLHYAYYSINIVCALVHSMLRRFRQVVLACPEVLCRHYAKIDVCALVKSVCEAQKPGFLVRMFE